MQWRVQCFAGIRDLIGRPELLVELPEGATAADLKRYVEDEFPLLRKRMAAVRVAAGYDFVGEFEPLPPGSDLALIPPVSGGAPEEAPDSVWLSSNPLSPPEAVLRVEGPDAGAVLTFVGTVRARSRDQDVLHLDYEVYPAMALDRMKRIAEEARATTGALRVALVHRTGRVAVGEASVVIAVAAAHRDAAFLACRAIIESLKVDVPIWKKEVYAGGSIWVGWGS